MGGLAALAGDGSSTNIPVPGLHGWIGKRAEGLDRAGGLYWEGEVEWIGLFPS